MLLLIVGMACLGAALFLVGEIITLPARQRETSIKRAVNYGRPRTAVAIGQDNFQNRVVFPFRTWLAGIVLRLSPKTTVDSVRSMLFAAGMGRNVSATGFLAAKAGLAITGAIGGVVLGAAVADGAGGVLLLGALLAGCGYLIPDFVVKMRGRRRRDEIGRELPDALDLLAVSIEAGLGFDAAVAKLIDRSEGPLIEEFEIVLAEMRIGESRENALKKMGERTDVTEVNNFVRAMVQADQLGMSIGRILRVQATETRLKRQAAAEERAMKAPIKMLFPTVLFIFPAMFLVVLGPAFMQLSELF